ncbi:Pyranose dehydrogenase 1 [Psilocybe cubensis]|uniref:Pyranose dehydrogenase 1 n=2 Tax=Psilocybe cubensis TaxID=181762 RepID=A0ACB8GUM9_PSICU|nr:Pyranose dehydrogenase 1 [Psilocybe cubensis]KAH9479331.1 Pyranose dehydrogenase 1 [Psilocybe cubensis]
MMAFYLHRFINTCLVFSLLNAIPVASILLTMPLRVVTTVYDYVIVGGGTAGLVLASRLTENSSVTVLVLEAGLNNQGITSLQVPFLAPTLAPQTAFDWNTSTSIQPGLLDRTVPYIRGRVLGGSSSINFLFHQYCTSDDWNRFGNVGGDKGWRWANMAQYVTKHEKMVPPADNHNTTGQFDPTDHGTTGVLPVSLPGNNQSIDARVWATTQQLPEFFFNEDTAGGNHGLLGVGFIQSSAGGGIRSSSSNTYLANAINRPNLFVLVNATVLSLVQTGNSSTGAPSFRGVQFMASPIPPNTTIGPTQMVTARKDVILSAGTVGTTQLLQLSGIGNSSDLGRIRINTIIDNPSVGANLSDHILIPNVFEVNGNGTANALLRDANASSAALSQWLSKKTGPFANSVANNYGFLRFPANSTIFQTTPDPTPGHSSPHWEIIFSNLFFEPGVSIPATRDFLTVVTALLSPTSRGTISLRNNDPFTPPIVDPQYMTTDFDVFAVRESIKGALRFVSAPAWSDYVVGPFGSAFAGATTDPLIESYARGVAGSAFHAVGTASMSPFNANWGVVNPDLTVKGADGLRIVDASVFPFVPSCHTQGPVYLLAERAADIIKAAG